ncbi:putative disease resistance protein At1g50180 [Hibiscus syriacus]|uniref:putative disease resistance protein At1g50180 n=1 Tax=Hibiscus syriacus TaxID=106335 RepID=UPI001921C019|nr:putative disease resistance protein At1g50180 [Hibiscus syriacus]
MDFAAVSFVLETIGELSQQVKSLLGVEDQVESLEREQRWMQGFLNVADARKVDNKVIRTSVAEIRELAYDVEDVIETFTLKVASERKSGFSNSVRRSICFFKEGRLLHMIRSEIKKIRYRIEELTRRLKTYDVAMLVDQGEGPSSSAERREARQPFPHKMDENIVGMDGDIKKLVSVLVEEESECRFVSIWGMGGLRKTTLAKKIYHHNQVIGHFNHLVWVYVSQQFQRRKVWETVLSGLENLNEDDRKKRDEELAEKLYNFLKDEKCLVIFDDISSTKDWDSLEPAFPVEMSRKILITSRNKSFRMQPKRMLRKTAL